MIINTIYRRTTRVNIVKIMCSFMESYHVPYLETYQERSWGIFYKTRTRVNYSIKVSF